MEPHGFDGLARCLDVHEAHIGEAIGARDDTRALLAHLSQISAPGTGVAKALLVYARMATTACDWVDGDLRIELSQEGSTTVVEAYTELGGGLLERLFAPMRFNAPLAEFARAIARVPQMIAPLASRGSNERRIVLCVSQIVRRTTAPPAAMSIAPESLFVRAPRSPSAFAFEPDADGLPVVGVPLVRPGDDDDLPPASEANVDAGWDD